MTEKEILLDAIDTYGEDSQLKMLLEEMSELQKEICKYWRGKDEPWFLAEEIADVEIMLEQVKLIFRLSRPVDDCRKQKVARLQARLEVYKNEHR